MKPVNLYEVHNHKGEVEWGGSSEREAVVWFRKGFDRKIYVSVWDESGDELDFKLITDKIDVTKLLLSCLTWTLDDRHDPLPWKDKQVKW